MHWISVSDLGQSYNFICGHCGAKTGNYMGYSSRQYGDWHILICPSCTKPVFLFNELIVPSGTYGEPVKGLPESINQLYEEARRAMQANACNAAALLCRKLLMHIAIAKGADENQTFAHYVSYLVAKGYVHADYKEWVDHIRVQGNQVTHEIDIFGREDADELMELVKMLLRLVYEFPAKLKAKSSRASP